MVILAHLLAMVGLGVFVTALHQPDAPAWIALAVTGMLSVIVGTATVLHEG